MRTRTDIRFQRRTGKNPFSIFVFEPSSSLLGKDGEWPGATCPSTSEPRMGAPGTHSLHPLSPWLTRPLKLGRASAQSRVVGGSKESNSRLILKKT